MGKDLDEKLGEDRVEPGVESGVASVPATASDDTASDDATESLAEFDEVIVQKGGIIFVTDGEDFLKIPVEFKVNLSCSGGEEGHGIITAVGWVVSDSFCAEFGSSGGRIENVLSKCFFDIGVSCGKATVLNYVVDQFYTWLKANSARFEVDGSDEVGFADVAASHDAKTATIP